MQLDPTRPSYQKRRKSSGSANDGLLTPVTVQANATEVMKMRKVHLLLVDSNPDELRLLIELLRSAGFRVTVAFDGSQGYKRARASLPDLILMEAHMPQTDGFTACRLLKSDPATCAIPVIFLSAASGLEERLEGLQSGAVDYVLKPFEPAEVLARIRIHLKLWAPAVPVEPSSAPAGLSSDEVMVKAAVEILSRNLAHSHHLAHLARQVGAYEKKLSRIFRQHMGVTVFEFLRDERLKLARSLLLETSLSVADIADEVGFSSAANFATAFRARFQTTPTVFRETGGDPAHVPPPLDKGSNS